MSESARGDSALYDFLLFNVSFFTLRFCLICFQTSTTHALFQAAELYIYPLLNICTSIPQSSICLYMSPILIHLSSISWQSHAELRKCDSGAKCLPACEALSLSVANTGQQLYLSCRGFVRMKRY